LIVTALGLAAIRTLAAPSARATATKVTATAGRDDLPFKDSTRILGRVTGHDGGLAVELEADPYPYVQRGRRNPGPLPIARPGPDRHPQPAPRRSALGGSAGALVLVARKHRRRVHGDLSGPIADPLRHSDLIWRTTAVSLSRS